MTSSNEHNTFALYTKIDHGNKFTVRHASIAPKNAYKITGKVDIEDDKNDSNTATDGDGVHAALNSTT